MLFIIGKGFGWVGGKSWHQIKNKEKKKLENSYKNQRKACALFDEDHPQVMYTKQKEKDLGVFTGQAYTVVYATVKYLLYHLYIGN